MTKQRLTVCFADIERFNVAARNMSLQELGEFLQAFYERAGEVLLAHNGRLIKYIADGFVATFEAGREEVAVRAMWALREGYRADVQDRAGDLRASALAAGIATGEVLAGQFGHPQMLAYDVLGKALTVAEALCQCRGIVVDGATFDAIAGSVTAEAVDMGGEVRGYRITGFR